MCSLVLILDLNIILTFVDFILFCIAGDGQCPKRTILVNDADGTRLSLALYS